MANQYMGRDFLYVVRRCAVGSRRCRPCQQLSDIQFKSSLGINRFAHLIVNDPNHGVRPDGYTAAKE